MRPTVLTQFAGPAMQLAAPGTIAVICRSQGMRGITPNIHRRVDAAQMLKETADGRNTAG